MVEISKYICDFCKNELFNNGVYSRTCLNLKEFNLPIENSMIATCDVYVYPIIDEDKFFCSLRCLKHWSESHCNG